MVPVVFSDAMLMAIPPHYAGRWRAVFYSEMKNTKGDFEECTRVYADVFEE